MPLRFQGLLLSIVAVEAEVALEILLAVEPMAVLVVMVVAALVVALVQ